MQRRAAARERTRRRLAVAGAALGVLVLLGGIGAAVALTGGSSTSKPHPKALPTPSASASSGTTLCQYTRPRGATGKVRNVGVPTPVGSFSQPYVMHIHTNRGDLTVDLTDKAPCTAHSFAFLASRHYFDHTPCHRLTSAGSLYVLQCGDWSGTGTGGPGYEFPDENLPGGQGCVQTTTVPYPAGTVAMANAGPGTNGSQFFIVYKDSTLPPCYTPFGTVASGLHVVKAVAKAGTDNANAVGDGHPKENVTILSLTVQPA